MSWFDLGAFVIIVLAAIDGARSGLAWSVTEACLIVATAGLTRAVEPVVRPYVGKVLELSPTELPWASHTIVFLVLALGLTGVAVLLHPLLERCRFPHDKWPGGLMGAGTGALLSVVLLALSTWSGPRAYEEQLEASYTTRALVAAWDSGATFLFPERLGHRVDDLRAP